MWPNVPTMRSFTPPADSRFYAGVDRHARASFLVILDRDGHTCFARNLPANPNAFSAPSRRSRRLRVHGARGASQGRAVKFAGVCGSPLAGAAGTPDQTALSECNSGRSSFFGPFFAAKHLGPDNPWKIA
jgi:hypothetical protein